MARIAQKETAAIAERADRPPMHPEIRNPMHVAEANRNSCSFVHERTQGFGARRLLVVVVILSIYENEPTLIRQRRHQHEAACADDDPAALWRRWKGKPHICDDVLTRVRLAAGLAGRGGRGGPGAAARRRAGRELPHGQPRGPAGAPATAPAGAGGWRRRARRGRRPCGRRPGGTAWSGGRSGPATRRRWPRYLGLTGDGAGA